LTRAGRGMDLAAEFGLDEPNDPSADIASEFGLDALGAVGREALLADDLVDDSVADAWGLGDADVHVGFFFLVHANCRTFLLLDFDSFLLPEGGLAPSVFVGFRFGFAIGKRCGPVRSWLGFYFARSVAAIFRKQTHSAKFAGPELAGRAIAFSQRQRLIPKGIDKFSPAWQTLARRARPSTVLANRVRDFNGLATSWNRMALRHGDQVSAASSSATASSSAKPVAAHANAYLLPGVLKGAFSSLGANQTLKGEVSIDATRRGLELMVTVSSLTHELFREHALSLQLTVSSKPAVVITRFFDGTPMFLKFGSLAGAIMEHARYLKKYEPPPGVPGQFPRWKTISYEEVHYRTRCCRHP